MPKIKALSPIRHNGTPYVAGDEFEVTKDEAQYLIELNAAEMAGGKSAKKPTAAELAAEKAASEKEAADQEAAKETEAADKQAAADAVAKLAATDAADKSLI